MTSSPFQFTRGRRCSYCGSLTHIVQFCPKTYAGRSNIESRERVKQLVNSTRNQ
ncbi:hypothetical protein ETAF_ple058 (plasmid) [Edwardsiella tarda FL6-60]|uniref:Uncharacterized protein n=1 Tax=Edwardsiella tarda (strain FL6-60) TaxID=718251 RepID=A0A0H3DVT8_EDWTF|nr:hypothetical protein ETAF_ple058 [Edwardsiella tarda FL6-60]